MGLLGEIAIKKAYFAEAWPHVNFAPIYELWPSTGIGPTQYFVFAVKSIDEDNAISKLPPPEVWEAIEVCPSKVSGMFEASLWEYIAKITLPKEPLYAGWTTPNFVIVVSLVGMICVKYRVVLLYRLELLHNIVDKFVLVAVFRVVSFSDDLGTRDLNGDLGFTNGEIFPVEFERVIAGLNVGDVSEAISYEGNIHFLKVTELDGADIESFEDKKSELEGELKQIAFEAKILEISNAIGGQAYNFEEVAGFAESFSLSLENFENQNISQTNFNFTDPQAVFDSQIGSWSQAVELSNDEYAFVYVYDVIAQSTEELANVESSIVDSLIEINKGSSLDALFASEEEVVLEADVLEEVFSLNNVTVDELKNINRSTSLLKSDLINILFNEYETGVTLKELTNDGVLFYTVVNRTRGDISKVSDEDKLFINEETQRNMLQTAFNKLRKEYDLDNKLSLNNQFIALNS